MRSGFRPVGMRRPVRGCVWTRGDRADSLGFA
jgi:hypothetical protein